MAGIGLFAGANSVYPLALMYETQSSGTDGGTFTSGSFVLRPMTFAFVNDNSFATIDSGAVTVGPGKYRMLGFVPGHGCGNFRSRLRRTSGTAATFGFGSNATCDVGNADTSIVFIEIEFDEETTFELQAQCDTTRATDGFGVATGFSGLETYSQLFVWKLR